jgi:hypothetical protein
MSYTEEEKQAFAAKDLRISKLSCLSTAAAATPGIETEDLIIEAQKLLDWVYGNDTPVSTGCQKHDASASGQMVVVNNHPNDNVSETDYPTPTLEQKKALELVEKETGKNIAQVWAMFHRFPTMKNVDSAIKKIKEMNNES